MNRKTLNTVFSLSLVVCSQPPMTRTLIYQFPWRFELLGVDCIRWKCFVNIICTGLGRGNICIEWFFSNPCGQTWTGANNFRRTMYCMYTKHFPVPLKAVNIYFLPDLFVGKENTNERSGEIRFVRCYDWLYNPRDQTFLWKLSFL